MRNRSLSTVSAIVLALLLGAHSAGAAAKPKSFTSSFSGTFVSVPLDIDNDSCTSSPPFVCTDLSAYENAAGKVTGGGSASGPFTEQEVTEGSPVAGTGCSINPTGQESCTLGTVTDACEYTFDAGSFVHQKTATGDLTFGSVTPGGSLCLDFNSAGGFALPYPFAGTSSSKIAGGTGKLAGTTGTFTTTFSGQILSSDSQGHIFGWSTGTSKGTTP